MCTGVKDSATQEESLNFCTSTPLVVRSTPLTDARQSASDGGVYCKSTVDSLASDQSLAYGLFHVFFFLRFCVDEVVIRIVDRWQVGSGLFLEPSQTGHTFSRSRSVTHVHMYKNTQKLQRLGLTNNDMSRRKSPHLLSAEIDLVCHD